MPVRDFDDQRRFVVQLYIVYDLGKLPAEFLGQEENPDFLVGDGFFQSILQFVTLMYYNAFHTCQSHPCAGIDVVTDQKHFHNYNLPMIMKEMIRP